MNEVEFHLKRPAHNGLFLEPDVNRDLFAVIHPLTVINAEEYFLKITMDAKSLINANQLVYQ